MDLEECLLRNFLRKCDWLLDTKKSLKILSLITIPWNFTRENLIRLYTEISDYLISNYSMLKIWRIISGNACFRDNLWLQSVRLCCTIITRTTKTYWVYTVSRYFQYWQRDAVSSTYLCKQETTRIPAPVLRCTQKISLSRNPEIHLSTVIYRVVDDRKLTVTNYLPDRADSFIPLFSLASAICIGVPSFKRTTSLYLDTQKSGIPCQQAIYLPRVPNGQWNEQWFSIRAPKI